MQRTRLSLLALALAGCPDRPIASVYPVQGTVESKDLPAVPNRDVDILFLIDDSLSMEAEQASLRANFGGFMSVLETLDGGIPNVHIGVATSNYGQHANDGVGTASFGTSCAASGDDGALRTAPALINGRFIVDEEGTGGSRVRNYSGTLGDAFSTIANVGKDGCGIEQHLGSIRRALENPVNAGFVRKNAKLAVIVIADEDDCSLAHKSLFEGSTDGEVVNFRCTSSGVECDTGSDLTAPGEKTGCHAKESSEYLNSVDSYVDYLKSLKAAPAKDVIVAGIVGDPDKFKITTNAGKPILAPSCEYGDQDAFPAVRTNDFLEQFENHVRTSICGADLSQALVDIGATLKRSFGDYCFESEVADLDPVADGLQADCAVSDWRSLPNGGDQELAIIPQCGAGRIPCWKIDKDPTKCFYTPSHDKLVIDRGGVVPSSDIHVKVNCVTTDDSGQVQ